jgi:hypothetical protein
MSPAVRRVFAALLIAWLPTDARAQTVEDRGGVSVRRISVSSGYASEQLPPITLGGLLPSDTLDADFITTAEGEIDWRRITPRTQILFGLAGSYTARKRYSQLSAPGGDLSAGISRLLGRRWTVGASVAGSVASADRLAFEPTQTGRLVDGATSFDDLAGTVALARSPSPDLSQAVLFVPIRETTIASDAYGNRLLASSVKAEATYVHSVKLATSVHAIYSTVRRLGSSHEPGLTLALEDSSAENAGVSIKYGRSERSQLTADVSWSKTLGGFTDEAVFATIGYGWSGRKWFGAGSVGAALRPFAAPATLGPVTTTGQRRPAIIYNPALGYRYGAQTLLVQYSRATHDQYGSGGRNIVTGFEGDVQTVGGVWSWSPPRGQWSAQADFSMVRRPGNFSYIYAWLTTFGVDHQLGPTARIRGELVYDRHGSRGFEGFHLTREGARVNVIWTPRRRPIS